MRPPTCNVWKSRCRKGPVAVRLILPPGHRYAGLVMNLCYKHYHQYGPRMLASGYVPLAPAVRPVIPRTAVLIHA